MLGFFFFFTKVATSVMMMSHQQKKTSKLNRVKNLKRCEIEIKKLGFKNERIKTLIYAK